MFYFDYLIWVYVSSNEIEATLNRLKKLEKDLTVKEKKLREVNF